MEYQLKWLLEYNFRGYETLEFQLPGIFQNLYRRERLLDHAIQCSGGIYRLKLTRDHMILDGNPNGGPRDRRLKARLRLLVFRGNTVSEAECSQTPCVL
ncbi:hypothetical protein J6590_081621 [Homalodisca vitripennis]|nr:hypothetical protein J6590_081621 [Homalodisca vitripennis]